MNIIITIEDDSHKSIFYTIIINLTITQTHYKQIEQYSPEMKTSDCQEAHTNFAQLSFNMQCSLNVCRIFN